MKVADREGLPDQPNKILKVNELHKQLEPMVYQSGVSPLSEEFALTSIFDGLKGTAGSNLAGRPSSLLFALVSVYFYTMSSLILHRRSGPPLSSLHNENIRCHHLTEPLDGHLIGQRRDKGVGLLSLLILRSL
jgi:hypothetical protein